MYRYKTGTRLSFNQWGAWVIHNHNKNNWQKRKPNLGSLPHWWFHSSWWQVGWGDQWSNPIIETSLDVTIYLIIYPCERTPSWLSCGLLTFWVNVRRNKVVIILYHGWLHVPHDHLIHEHVCFFLSVIIYKFLINI